MSDETDETPRDEVLKFEAPVPLHALDEEGLAVTEPVHDIGPGDVVAIPNPWRPEKTRFLTGRVRGSAEQQLFVLVVGHSFGQLEKTPAGWVCHGLVTQASVARGIALEELEDPPDGTPARDCTPEFEAACNGEIDLIPVNEVGDDILEEIDRWSEIGWLLLECGCLVGPNGVAVHGHAEAE